MINLQNTWAVALTEARLTRRLARYWIFLLLSMFMGGVVFFYYSAIHTFISSVSSTAGIINPRYFVAAIGATYLVWFILGFIFLGFDVRARDVRETMVEVLDSRPMTNLELVLGRFLGLFLCSFVPLVGLVILLQGIGYLMPLLGSPLGRPMEPYSMFVFVLYSSVPAIVFALGMVFLVTLVVRHRMVAAVLCIAAVAGMFWGVLVLPGSSRIFLDFIGIGQGTFPSDFIRNAAVPGGWWQRAGILFAGLAMLVCAALIHPRLDSGNRKLMGIATVLLLAIGIGCLSVTSSTNATLARQLVQWKSAHEARQAEPVPDIESINGSVHIDPGSSLRANLVMTIRAPQGQALQQALFSLNPGLAVQKVSSQSGGDLSFEQADGLLQVNLGRTLEADQSMTLELDYEGAPNTFYGYIDSAFSLTDLTVMDGNVILLGTSNSIFDSRYVGLMPGSRWLPASGVDVGRDDTRNRPRDFFTLDLEFEIPADWLIAGPGKRREVDPGKGIYRFAPPVALPEAGVFAARFKSFATEIDGITFEALVHPGHDSNFEYLADAREEIEQWIADKLEVTRDVGLDYPYGAFTLVEVPITMRGYEGGWRLGTAMAPPAMVLMRENGFPTARFDFDLLGSSFFGNSRDTNQEGGLPRIKRDRVIQFFNNDISGGNLFTGAARSLFAHRTTATGPDAIALDFTLQELATLIFTGEQSYFSAHLFKSINSNIQTIVLGSQGRANIDGVNDAIITAFTSKPTVWESVLSVPLANIDPWNNPQQTIDVLTLKGGKLAAAIHDWAGVDDSSRLLAHIIDKHSGASYTRADVVEAAAAVDTDLGDLFRDWFTSTDMPGFVVDNVELFQLPDNENGDSQYQLKMRIRNDESVVGFTRISWYMVAFGDPTYSDPIRINGRSAVEVGVVTTQPPVSLHLDPYLSLNRESFTVKILNQEEIQRRTAEPFDGVRDAPWDTGTDDRIYADDLDEGFIVSGDEAAASMRIGGGGIADTEMDNGLPVGLGPVPPKTWHRRYALTGWGRYRHTSAYIGAGTGNQRAIMPVTIPRPGTWELEIHVPWFNNYGPQQRGTWHLEVVSENGREKVAYDATVAEYGWNLVGEFQLPAGEVKVEYTNETDGRMVLADAIAWSPVGSTRQTTAE